MQKGLDDFLEAAFEDRISGDGEERGGYHLPQRGQASPVRPGLIQSLAIEDRTLQGVVTSTNRRLKELWQTGATILSLMYARQEQGTVGAGSYLGVILYRMAPAPDEDQARQRMAGVLPFRRREATDDTVALLAHASAPAQAPHLSRDERADDLRQQTSMAIGRLAEQLAEGHSAGFRAYLAFMGRFRDYSAHNALLIYLQRPTATRCAGLSLWNQLGYSVRKGERGLWIWAPMLRRAQDDEQDDREGGPERLVGFRPAVVFDAGQLAEIDERPLPSPPRCRSCPTTRTNC